MTNKQALELFETGSFSEIFIEYLKKQQMDFNSISNFINKAKQIHACLSANQKDIGMLVGKVQSGKTTVFSGVIARYFDKGFDLCIILTSNENLLNYQTNERMNTVFKSKQPSKVDIFNCDNFLIRNSARRIEKVNDDLNSGHKYIVTILKNKQIEKVNEVLINNKIWKNKKILIIDDEADLASVGSNDNEEFRYANSLIKNLLNTLANYNYLSVTATPQAQVLINDHDVVKPRHVFTYEPGKDYMGIEEFFNSTEYFHFIKQNEWDNPEKIVQLPESLKNAVIHYFINISGLIHEQQKILNTTMLVHTSVTIEDHYKLMRLLIKYKDNLLFYLLQNKESLDYKNTLKKIKAIFDTCNYSIVWDEDYINLIINVIKHTNVNIINSESDDSIIENINNIVLGSRKLERGVTLDNLLLTYITNFQEKSTAVDTILQRARWFGYRQKIKKFLSIYIVPNLHQQYKQYIMPSEHELWNRLKEAERLDNFKDFEKYISLEGKSAPTNKVKTLHSKSEKVLYSMPYVERDKEIEQKAKSIYLKFKEYPAVEFKICMRDYNGLFNLSFTDFCELIADQKIYEVIGVDNYFWKEIVDKASKYNFIVIFFDTANNNDYRERKSEDNRYQLFEGKDVNTGFPGENVLYKTTELQDKVIIGLHKIRDKDDQKLRYYISLHLPLDNDFNGKFFIKE